MKPHKSHLKLKDYSVSGDSFELFYDPSREMLYTHPKPPISELSNYYSNTNYISHTNQRKSFFDLLYHAVRSVSVRRKLRLLKPYQSKQSALLDVGAGTGFFLRAAKKRGWTVTGIEPNPSARNRANLKAPNSVFDTTTLQKLPEKSFDVITLWHVLEHLPNLEGDIKMLQKLLKPNGRIVLAVPNYKSFDALYFKNFWAAYDVPRHLWHFSQHSISCLFSEVQMKLELTHPLVMDSFYVSFLSNKLKSGSLRILNSLWVGLLSNIKALNSGEYSSLIYVLKNTN